MRQEDTNIKPHSFSLGPFEVRCLPRYHGIYSLYIVTASGVPVRRQISCPEVADGWVGLAFTLEDYSKNLTSAEKDLLIEFKQQVGSNRKLMNITSREPRGQYTPWRKRTK